MRLTSFSVDNEQFGADFSGRTVGFRIVRDLVAHAWFEREPATVFQFSVELALDAKEYVAFDTPMIRPIARRVFNHANAHAAEVLSAPIGRASLAFVFGGFNLRPIRDSEGDARNLQK